MFIVSTKAYGVRLTDGSLFRIPRGFIGEIPSEIAESAIVQLAIKDGSISTPAAKKDAAIEEAIEVSEKKAVETQQAKEDAAVEKAVEVQKAKEKKSK